LASASSGCHGILEMPGSSSNIIAATLATATSASSNYKGLSVAHRQSSTKVETICRIKYALR